MSWGFTAVAAATVITGAAQADNQRSSGNKAADAQSRNIQAGIDNINLQVDASADQFDDQIKLIQDILEPYTDAGRYSATAQGDLAGVRGPRRQERAIKAIENSAEYEYLLEEGEEAILQNASATGGLRGGNTQDALAEYRPELLSSLIDKRFSQYGSIADRGLNASSTEVAGTSSLVGSLAGLRGNAALAIGELFSEKGAVEAGKELNQGQAREGLIDSIGGVVSSIGGLF